MKFTFNWLKDFLDSQASLNEICDNLTNIGLEIESVVKNDSLTNLLIAQILDARPHPNADKLQILTVNIAQEENLEIVCGASNARAGLISVLAPIDCYLPAIDLTIKKSKIRSVESMGMMCSAQEIGFNMGFLNDGIIELPIDATIGASFTEYANLDTSAVIEIAITPNRGDCCSLYGIARDLAAKDVGKLQAPNAGQLNYWQSRLEAIGEDVDLATYLTLSYGEPIIALDKAKLKGELSLGSVKTATNFKAITGKDYIIPANSLVLKDEQEIVAIAGLIASENSGCTKDSKEFILTIIKNNDQHIAKTANQLSIKNSCSYRYERGIDQRKVSLPTIKNASFFYNDSKIEPSYINLNLNKLNSYLGKIIDISQIITILTKLGLKISTQQSEELKLQIPSWRNDLKSDVDIINEILRIHGVDNIPTEALPKTENLNKSIDHNLKAKYLMASIGFIELMNWSFISAEQAEHFGGGLAELKLQNPIASNKSDMRPSLLPGLLNAAAYNAAHNNKNLAFFEVSHIYKNAQTQCLSIAAIRQGNAQTRNWRHNARKIDIFDAKADVITLLEAFNIKTNKLAFVREAPSYFHPSRSAAIKYSNDILGYFGEFHPSTLKLMDIEESICGFEIDLAKVLKYSDNKIAAYEAQLQQPIYRDLAFIVDKNQAAFDIQKLAYKQSDLIKDVKIFDIYEGPNIGFNKKSLAIEITLIPKKTLTSEEIDVICQKIINEITTKTNAILRS